MCAPTKYRDGACGVSSAAGNTRWQVERDQTGATIIVSGRHGDHRAAASFQNDEADVIVRALGGVATENEEERELLERVLRHYRAGTLTVEVTDETARERIARIRAARTPGAGPPAPENVLPLERDDRVVPADFGQPDAPRRDAAWGVR